MSKTPFEIRLELLKMAKEMLETDYHSQRDRLSSEWGMKAGMAQEKREELPPYPIIPPFPTASDVIEKAKVLNMFVSNS